NLIMRLLAKEPKDRPVSAAVVAKVLETLEKQAAVPVAVPLAKPVPAAAPLAVPIHSTTPPNPWADIARVARPESAKGVAEAPEAAPRPSKTPGVPPWRRRVLVAAFAAAAVILAAITIISVSTDKGELVIKADSAVEVTIKRNGKPVEDLELKKGDN